MRFGFDDNLGLPEGVADFDECETVSYHDVGSMLAAFEGAELDAMFAPAGTLPYLAPGFDVVAQATLGEKRRVLPRQLCVGSHDFDAGGAEVARRVRRIDVLNRIESGSSGSFHIVALPE
jgi:hypothetical protein